MAKKPAHPLAADKKVFKTNVLNEKTLPRIGQPDYVSDELAKIEMLRQHLNQVCDNIKNLYQFNGFWLDNASAELQVACFRLANAVVVSVDLDKYDAWKKKKAEKEEKAAKAAAVKVKAVKVKAEKELKADKPKRVRKLKAKADV